MVVVMVMLMIITSTSQSATPSHLTQHVHLRQKHTCHTAVSHCTSLSPLPLPPSPSSKQLVPFTSSHPWAKGSGDSGRTHLQRTRAWDERRRQGRGGGEGGGGTGRCGRRRGGGLSGA